MNRTVETKLLRIITSLDKPDKSVAEDDVTQGVARAG